MYFDLYLPFPSPSDTIESSKKKKGKSKAAPPPDPAKDCWAGLTPEDKATFARSIGLTGHLGYTVAGCTIYMLSPQTSVLPSPFANGVPYPSLDPRFRNVDASSSKLGPALVQATRYHMRLDDTKTHCLTSANTTLLREYDILSVAPNSDKALQLACTDLSLPGTNQISIISLPLHEKPYFFRLNRKQIRQAQRNGVMFEIIYSPALFPSPSLTADVARKYRQNFMSNAREVIRITEGKNIIFSSGPGGSAEGMRGPLDLVNLGTLLGMPANLAKDSVSLNPKLVLLRAQARRTYKAILSMPKIVPARPVETSKRAIDEEEGEAAKRARLSAT
ncbi:ribonuclease P/MRP protein subunit RPP1, partial [Tremellales sp. Uapishka_1]